jgi:hypothetical protein
MKTISATTASSGIVKALATLKWIQAMGTGPHQYMLDKHGDVLVSDCIHIMKQLALIMSST